MFLADMGSVYRNKWKWLNPIEMKKVKTFKNKNLLLLCKWLEGCMRSVNDQLVCGLVGVDKIKHGEVESLYSTHHVFSGLIFYLVAECFND